MMLRLLVLAGLITCSYATTPQIQLTTVTTGTSVEVQMTLFLNNFVLQPGQFIDTLSIVDATSKDNLEILCLTDFTAITPDPLTGGYLWTVTVDNAADAFTGSAAGCPHIVGVSIHSCLKDATGFTFFVRFYLANPADDTVDRWYPIIFTGVEINGRDLPGTTVNTPPPNTAPTVIPVTPATYMTTLAVTDAGDTVQTAMVIGDTIKLVFTLTVNPYRADIDFAGATVHSCQTATDAAFTQNVVTILGSNGCPAGGMMYNVATGSGFDRDGVDSTIVLTTKTYVARSAEFELGPYTQQDPTPPNMVYFKCSLTYCFDDTPTATVGECGGQHCDETARKKRSTNGDSEVVTSIQLLPRNESTSEPEDDLCACPDNGLLYGSVGGLGAVAAILFGMMVFTYLDLQRSYRQYWSDSSRSASKSRESGPGSSHKSPHTKSTRTGSVVTSYYG